MGVPPVTEPLAGEIAATALASTGPEVLLAFGTAFSGATDAEHPAQSNAELATRASAAVRRERTRGLAGWLALLGTAHPSRNCGESPW
jgi:hypothetical protein